MKTYTVLYDCVGDIVVTWSGTHVVRTFCGQARAREWCRDLETIGYRFGCLVDGNTTTTEKPAWLY
jgi:hypothetical protein